MNQPEESEQFRDDQDEVEPELFYLVETRVVKINRVSICDSPILTCMLGDTAIYVVLVYRATSSLITLEKASSLGLRIQKTRHLTVQVDGQSTLKIVGETSLILHFIEVVFPL